MKNVGALVKTEVALAPISTDGAAAVNGVAIDMKGFRSCVFTGISGLESGSPTAYEIEWKVQSSEDGSTGWADVSGITVTETGDISVDYADEELEVIMEQDVNDSTQRYLRLVADASFTGGSSPEIVIGGTVTKGEAINTE